MKYEPISHYKQATLRLLSNLQSDIEIFAFSIEKSAILIV